VPGSASKKIELTFAVNEASPPNKVPQLELNQNTSIAWLAVRKDLAGRKLSAKHVVRIVNIIMNNSDGIT